MGAFHRQVSDLPRGSVANRFAERYGFDGRLLSRAEIAERKSKIAGLAISGQTVAKTRRIQSSLLLGRF